MGKIVHFGRRTHIPVPKVEKDESWTHWLTLALVAVTICSGAVVFSEPAPVDALTMGLLVLLPAVGLVAVSAELVLFLATWLVIAGCGLLASMLATDVALSTTHTAVSLYLYLAAFIFAAFVARSPKRHMELILGAYRFAALTAALVGVVGYFAIVPGAEELFTRYGRAAGPFKDPNVFGAFLVLAMVYELHLAVTKRSSEALQHLAGLALLTLAVLLTFSRGAWAAAGIAILVYGYLAFVTARRNCERLKLVALAGVGALSAVLIVGAAMQDDTFAKLMDERATLAQSYDVGPEGRFGGQDKARDLVLDYPLGIGAREFSSQYHSEDVHNVYLSMFLNSGWLGGLLYLMLALVTAAYGLRHAFKRTATQPLFIVAYAALLATMLLGLLIDSDHWRHFYLLMGLAWGLMTGDRRIERGARIIADRRPLLLRQTILVPPPRRRGRIVRSVPHRLPPYSRPATPRRPARIVAAMA